MDARALCRRGGYLAQPRRTYRRWLLRNRTGPHPRAGRSADMSYAAVRDKLDRGKPVLLDGGIGTEILRREVTWADHQLTRQPDLVRAIHTDYIRAGADVLST